MKTECEVDMGKNTTAPYICKVDPVAQTLQDIRIVPSVIVNRYICCA